MFMHTRLLVLFLFLDDDSQYEVMNSKAANSTERTNKTAVKSRHICLGVAILMLVVSVVLGIYALLGIMHA